MTKKTKTIAVPAEDVEYVESVRVYNVKLPPVESVKAWIYLWPDAKDIKDGHLYFERTKISTQKALKLREFEIEIILKDKK